MRSALVSYNGVPAGTLSKVAGKYWYTYLPEYRGRPVSITLPIQEEQYESDILFPPFVNMLSEGANKALQCRMLKIDEEDYFSLLLATADADPIGPITVKEIDIHEP
jgi:HipA-like protein